MLLESVLAELSIDILDDQQQQMLHVITKTPAASNGYDGDDEDEDNIGAPSNLELHSSEEWSPVSCTLELPQSPRCCTLELPQSPRLSYLFPPSNSSSPAPLTPSFDDSPATVPSGSAIRSAYATLLWCVFPCNKCIFLTWLRNRGKKKQPEWATGHQGGQDSKVASTSHPTLKMMLEASRPVQPTSVLKKKNGRSGTCNINCCNSAEGMKQVRFSVETDSYLSSSNEEEGTLPPPNLIDWASYGLF